jgi:tRNA (adenine37-N6)-methyltransferase
MMACRTPHRPNPIGITLAKLEEVIYGKYVCCLTPAWLELAGCRLQVDIKRGVVVVGGSDLVDGSPVLDIKPYVPAYDCPELRKDGPARVPAWSSESSFVTREVSFDDVALQAFGLIGEEERSVADALRVYKGEPARCHQALGQVLAVDVSRKAKTAPDGSLHRYRTLFDGLAVEYTLEGDDCKTRVLGVVPAGRVL